MSVVDCRYRLAERSRFGPSGPGVEIARLQPRKRIPDQVDEPCVWNDFTDALSCALRMREIRVVGGRFAPDLGQARELAVEKVQPSIPGPIIEEEVRLLHRAHLDFGVQVEVPMEAGRAALLRANNHEVGALDATLHAHKMANCAACGRS